MAADETDEEEDFCEPSISGGGGTGGGEPTTEGSFEQPDFTPQPELMYVKLHLTNGECIVVRVPLEDCDSLAQKIFDERYSDDYVDRIDDKVKKRSVRSSSVIALEVVDDVRLTQDRKMQEAPPAPADDLQ